MCVFRLEALKKREKQEAWDCRHWSQKPLEEMQDRDWRIFREDFNISIKGGRVPKPLRNWKEANLPKEVYTVILDVGYKVIFFCRFLSNEITSQELRKAKVFIFLHC